MSRTERFRQLGAALDLQPQQRPDFEHYVASLRDRSAKLHQQMNPLMEAVFEDMAKVQPDRAEIGRLLDQVDDKRREFQHDATAETLDFLAILTPEQREKFFEVARERRASRAARRR
jgi:Spy/CpxP family protein refolding chaperone